MRTRNVKREVALIVLGGLVLMFVLPQVPFLDYYTLTPCLIYGMLALSLGLIWGYGGVLCFGQAAFFGLGAYTYAIAAINIGDAWLPFALAIVLPALVAVALGAVVFYGRLTDVYLAVVTLVFMLILFRFMNATAGEAYRLGEARLGGFNGIPSFPTLHLPGNPEAYILDGNLYYFCFVALVIVYLLTRWLLRSSFGRVVVAIREHELRCELMGYDVRLYKTAVFAVGAAIAGLAGCLYANWAEIVTPELFSLGQSAEIIIWVIVGGLGSLLGPILGGMIMGYLKFLLGQQSLIDNNLVLGILLVLTVSLAPQGVLRLLRPLNLRRRRPSRSPVRRTRSNRRL